MLYGMTQRNLLSRFVREIDPKYLDMQKDNSFANVKNAFTQQTSKPSYNFGNYTKPQEKKPAVNLYQTGDRIKHLTFGEGTILSVIPMSADYMYEIAFDTVGTKKLMATYVSKLMKKI